MEKIELNLQVAHFLDNLPSGLTLSNIHDRLVCVFGKNLWSKSRIQRYLGFADNETVSGRLSIVGSDHELIAFFSQRRAHSTIDEMLAEAALHFPNRKLPSRSSLHRFLRKTRK